METKISYLAIVGTLGPMIGLVGTIAGMIDSFSVIATAGGQPLDTTVTGTDVIVLVEEVLGWLTDRGVENVIAVSDIEAAEGRGAHLVHIHDLEQQRHYWAAIEVVWRLGFRFDRGFGEQLALALDQWRSTRSEAEALAETLREPEPAAVQLGLFEVVR